MSGLNSPITPKRITDISHMSTGTFSGQQYRMSGANSRLAPMRAKLPTGRIKRPYAKRATLAKSGV